MPNDNDEIEEMYRVEIAANPEAFKYQCAYCQRPTKQRPHTDPTTGVSFPSCCVRKDCVDKWGGTFKN